MFFTCNVVLLWFLKAGSRTHHWSSCQHVLEPTWHCRWLLSPEYYWTTNYVAERFQSSWRLCSSLSSWTALARRSWWTWRNKGTCYLFIGQTNFNTLLRKRVQFKQIQFYTGWTHLCLVLWHGDLLELQGLWWSLWTGEEKRTEVFASFSSVSKTGLQSFEQEWSSSAESRGVGHCVTRQKKV